MADPTKVALYPKSPVAIGGQVYRDGDKVEVIGERQIAMVGSSPNSRKYNRLDLYEGSDVRYFLPANDAPNWREVDQKEADEAIGKKQHHGKK